jgi:hypothetical protein
MHQHHAASVPPSSAAHGERRVAALVIVGGSRRPSAHGRETGEQRMRRAALALRSAAHGAAGR